MELIDYVRHWLDTVKKTKVKPATLDRLVTSADVLESYSIAHKLIQNITADDCEEHVAELTGRGYALTTIKKQMLIVSAPLRYAYAHKQIACNPSVDLKPPSKANVQKSKKQIIAYDKAEQEKMRSILETQKREGYAAIELMMETGLRPGEVLALDWDDVDIARKRIYVDKTIVNLANTKQSYVQSSPKSETSQRQVPLSSRAIEILTHLQKQKKNNYLFPCAGGRRLSYEALRYQCQMACQQAGVQYRGLRIFRHTFATNMFYFLRILPTPAFDKEPKKQSVFLQTAHVSKAGEEGFEPSTKVLETHVLPLHHSPVCHTRGIIIERAAIVNRKIRVFSDLEAGALYQDERPPDGIICKEPGRRRRAPPRRGRRGSVCRVHSSE